MLSSEGFYKEIFPTVFICLFGTDYFLQREIQIFLVFVCVFVCLFVFSVPHVGLCCPWY